MKRTTFNSIAIENKATRQVIGDRAREVWRLLVAGENRAAADPEV
jgi:hypothetical protein